MNIQTHTLVNGIRVVHIQDVHAKVAHAGFVFKVGSRDELVDEHGLAHFLEHVLFKGTQKRSVHQVLNRMESVGGELNAHTTKEDISVYSSFLYEHYSRAIELMVDICFHSVFDPKEIEKEKQVVLDEVKSYLDNPMESIFEEFDEYLIPQHAIGRPILGTPKSIQSIDRKSILKFIEKHFKPQNIIFASVGNLTFEKLVSLLEKHTHSIQFSNKKYQRIKVSSVKSFHQRINKKTHQAHVLLGRKSYSVVSNSSTAMSLLNNLLGGPNMNSILNWQLREKMGITYHTESSYTPFEDIGLFNIYVGTDEKNIDKALNAIHKIIKNIHVNGLKESQWNQFQKQFLAQFMMGLEYRVNLMLALGKTYLVHDKVETLEEMERKILAVSTAKIKKVIDENLSISDFSSLIYVPDLNFKQDD